MRYVTSNFPFALQPIVRWVGEPGLRVGYSGDPLSPQHDPGQEMVNILHKYECHKNYIQLID